MAGKVRHLLYRHGKYFARLAVPADLREALGKRELLETLDADRRIALSLHPAAVARMQAIIAQARAAKPGETVTPLKRSIPLRTMARRHFEHELVLDERVRNQGLGVDYDADIFRPTYVALLQRVVAGKTSDDEMAAAIQWAIDASGSDVAFGSVEWRRAARGLAGVQLEVIRRASEVDSGRAPTPPAHPLLVVEPEKPKAVKDPLEARRIAPDSTFSLSELLPKFLKEKKPGGSAVEKYEVAVRTIEEFFGSARPIYQITRPDIVKYKEILQDMPQEYRSKFPGKTLMEAIKANGERKAPIHTLTPDTINQAYLQRVSSILNWAVNNGLIPDNVASNVRLDRVKGSTPSRVPFTGDELKRIFAPPLFKAKSAMGETHWTLLIALYTGMRASEIAQIRLDSIRLYRGVLCFTVEEQTKNVQSRRIVPVHSALISLGLEKRIATLTKAGKTHLFPAWFQKGQKFITDQSKAKPGKPVGQPYSKYIPRRFNDVILPKVDIHTGTKVFHSFRHTTKTALELSGVSRSIADAITGHDDQSSGGGYIHEFSVEAMKDALEKIHFDGLDLAKLVQ